MGGKVLCEVGVMLCGLAQGGAVRVGPSAGDLAGGSSLKEAFSAARSGSFCLTDRRSRRATPCDPRLSRPWAFGIGIATAFSAEKELLQAGAERLAHTTIVNPGRLSDGSAAWIDWEQAVEQQVELLDL